jgi:DnaJ-class molecular chaperone
MLQDLGHDDDRDLLDCPDCKGLGGFDASKDCEVYDDWQDCPNCGGTGKADEHYEEFMPERDAFTPND